MRFKRAFMTTCGVLCLVLGAIGVFVPLLPTTPFVLLAAVCFSYSSRRIYGWLRRTAFFGEFITNFEEKKGIPRSLKVKSIIFVWVSLSISMFVIQALWAYILLGVIGIAITIHVLMIRTKRP